MSRECYCCGLEHAHMRNGIEQWVNNGDTGLWLTRNCFRRLYDKTRKVPINVSCFNDPKHETSVGRWSAPQWYINPNVWGTWLCMTCFNSIKRSNEARHHMAVVKMGENNPMYGKMPSNAYQKGSVPWMKGRHHTPESNRINSQKNKIVWNTPEKREFAKKRRLEQKFNSESWEERCFIEQIKAAGVPVTKCKPLLGHPDGFVAPRIVIFYDGDFFHANPNWKKKQYKTEDVVTRGLTAGQIWEYDKMVTATLEAQGYIVLRFWAQDVSLDMNKCVKKVVETIGSKQGTSPFNVFSFSHNV